MSIVNVSKRFSSEIVNIFDHEFISLPFCTRSAEVMFFYTNNNISSDSFQIEKITKIVQRNIYKNTLSATSPQAYFSENELCEIFKTSIKHNLTIDEEYDFKEKYYSLYETAMPFLFKELVLKEQQNLFSELLDCFYKVVPNSGLRKVYSVLGKEYFEYLVQKTKK